MSTLNIKQIPSIPTSKIINFEEEVEQICGDGRSIQNQNPVITATDPLFHWEGTLEEYIEQDIEHTHPEWVCFINNDDTSESFDNRITNTATVIPQDIKLEWGENFIKLKAGSVLYIPNGFESDGVTKKFDKIVLEEDLIRYTSDEGTPNSTKDTIQFITYSRNEVATLEWTHHIELTEIIKTGTVNPTETAIMGFYNTDTNKYYYHIRDGVDWETSFPIAIITRHQEANVGYSYVELNQVFNGMGYFADYVYVLPGVSGLAPNGFNEDGTLKHNRIVVNKVILQHIDNYTNSNMPIAVGYLDDVLDINYQNNYYNQETDPEANWCFWYKHSDNKLYYRENEGYTVYPEYDQYNGFLMGFLSRNNGVVTRLSTRPAFEAVNASDFDEYKDESVDYKNISNCITKIPQDIKLELNNGILTLKAGSKVWYPNGFEADGVTKKFSFYILEEDKTAVAPDPGYGGKCSIFNLYDESGYNLFWTGIHLMTSGDTAPSVSSRYIWYDTANNLIKLYDDWNTHSWISELNGHHFNFPLCIFTVNNGTSGIKSLDQVFNGFGFIGHCSFVLPGVEGLIPDGRNLDGTLKSKKLIKQKVTLNDGSNTEITWRNSNDHIIIGADEGIWAIWEEDLLIDKYPEIDNTEWALVYDTSKNEYYRTNYGTPYQKSNCFNSNVKVYRNKTTGIIESMNYTGTTYRAVDYNDTSFIAHQAFPTNKNIIDLGQPSNELSITPPTDGWVALKLNNCSIDTRIAFDNYEMCVIDKAKDSNDMLSIFIPVKKDDMVILTLYSSSYTLVYFRFIYAVGTL